MSKQDISPSGKHYCILYGDLYTKYLNRIHKIDSRTNVENNLVLGEQGDIILPLSGETPTDISNSAVLPFNNIALGSDIIVFRPIDQNSLFLSYQISWKRKLDIAKIAQGKTIVHSSPKSLSKIFVFCPHLKEQEKISNFLSLIDEKIINMSSKIQGLKKYKEGLIQQALKSTIKVPLNKLINESLNKTVTNNQYVLLSSTAKGIFLQSDFFNHQVASKNNIGYKILEEGQIVFSPQNLWLGNINLLTKYKIGCVSPSYKIFDINTKIVDSNYLIEIMRTKLFLHKYKLCSEQGASVVRRNLDLDQFLNIRVPIPSNDKFYSLLKEINYLIEKESSKLNIIISIKNYLLKNMFI